MTEIRRGPKRSGTAYKGAEDQGIVTAETSDLVLADAYSLTFRRTTAQVITVVYLNPGRV